MVNFKKLLTALGTPTFKGLSLGSLSLPNSLSSLNRMWGFSPDANTRIRVEGGTIKIGGITLDDFNAMSPQMKLDYLNDPSVFDASTRAGMSSGIDANFVDKEIRAKAISKGRPGLETSRKKVTASNGSINTTSTSWTKLMTNLAKVTLLATGVVWTLAQLNALIEKNSGCFLEGPDGEQKRMGAPGTPCDCLDSDPTNPLRQACCASCKTGGDSSLICPDDSATDTWTDPYSCPADPAPAPASSRGGVRSAISVAASSALAQAQTLVPRSSVPDVAASATSDCVSCGCSTDVGEWTLCTRTADVWSVIGDMLADAGKYIEDGLLDIADAALGGIGGVLSSVLMYVGIVLGVGVVVGASILIARAVKKKKQRLQGGAVFLLRS